MEVANELMDEFVARRRLLVAEMMDANQGDFRPPTLAGCACWMDVARSGRPLPEADEIVVEKAFNLLSALFRAAGGMMGEPAPEALEEERRIMDGVSPDPVVLQVAHEIYGEGDDATEFALGFAAYQHMRSEGRFGEESLAGAMLEAIDALPETRNLDRDLKYAGRKIAMLQLQIFLGEAEPAA